MPKRALLIAGIASIALIVLFSFLFWLGARDRTAGPTLRRVHPWIVTPGQKVGVHLKIDAGQLPECNAPPTTFDAVLIIDRSGSMQNNNALTQATTAAIAFAEVLASGASRMGTVVFDDRVELLTPVGASVGDLRLAAARLISGGGTDIAAAMQMAGDLLIDLPDPLPAQVVVLLSDGGASDAGLALAAAQTLKSQGVYVITVGIEGDDYEPGLLQRLASSSGDFYNVDNLPSLSGLYRQLARSLSSSAATEVEWLQPYHADHFAMSDVSTLVASTHVTNTSVIWALPFLTQNGATLDYALTAEGIGWHDIAGTEGELKMIDCNGVALIQALSTGPRVFVSPLPAWLWPLLPFLFFIPLMIFGRRRGGPATFGGRDDSPIDFDFNEKPIPVNWVSDLRRIEPLLQQQLAIQYPDSLIVGVGATGEHVLSELRRLLVEQSGGSMPSNIRLLHIGATPTSGLSVADRASDLTSPLEASETLILRPDLERVVERLGRQDPSWAHLKWWGQNTPEAPGRAGARMALFYDLMLGEGQSHVWRALRRRLDGLHKPLVYVVASLAAPDEGGLALDLPHFVKQAATELGIDTKRVVAVFTLQRAGSKMAAELDAGRHAYAAVRELQRILLREPFAFEYSSEGGGRRLIGSTDSTPIDACYLLDGMGEKEDLSAVAEHRGLFPTLADALLTLLSAKVEPWYQDYVNGLPVVARRTEDQTGLPTISSLGCYVIQYPLFGLKRVAKWRFLLDLMFGGHRGAQPVGIARLDPANEKPALDRHAGMEGKEPRQRALAFLKDGGRPNRHPLMRVIAQLMEGEKVEELEIYRMRPGDRRIDQAFRWALRDEINLVLNGSTGDVVANRTGKLGGALVILSALLELLRDAEAEAPRRMVLVKYPELRHEVSSRLENWRRTVDNSLAQVRLWEPALVGVQAGSTTTETRRDRRQRRHESDAGDSTPAPLYERLTGELEKAQNQLAEAGVPQLRALLDHDDAQQNALYQRYLGPDLLKRTGGLRPLEEAIKRLGWIVTADAEQDCVQVRLLAAPLAVAGHEIGAYQHQFGPDQIDDLQNALQALAEHFLPLLDSEHLSEHLRPRTVNDLKSELLRGASPLLRYRREQIGEIGGTISSHLILSLSDPDLSKGVEERIKGQNEIVSPVQAVASDDPHRCALVGLTDVIPIASLEAIDLASLDYSSDALAHIFPAEQAAAEFEREWRTQRGEDWRFHPRFVRLLDNVEMARTLVQAWFYALLRIESSGLQRRAILRLDDGSESIEIAAGERLDLYDVLSSAYQHWLKANPDHALSRSKWGATQARLKKQIDVQRKYQTDLYAYAEGKRDEAAARLEQDAADRQGKESSQRRRPWLQDVDVFLWLLAEEEKRSSFDLK